MRDGLPLAPAAAAQQRRTKGRHGLGREVQTVEAEGGTARDPVPFGVVDAHRPEEPLVEEFRQAAAGDPFHHPPGSLFHAPSRLSIGCPVGMHSK